jgi:hypothetical protein
LCTSLTGPVAIGVALRATRDVLLHPLGMAHMPFHTRRTRMQHPPCAVPYRSEEPTETDVSSTPEHAHAHACATAAGALQNHRLDAQSATILQTARVGALQNHRLDAQSATILQTARKRCGLRMSLSCPSLMVMCTNSVARTSSTSWQSVSV